MAGEVSFLVPVAVVAVFALLRRLVPAREVPPPASEEMKALSRRYLWWDIGALVPFFVLAPALGFAWYFLLQALVGFFLPSPASVRFLLAPGKDFWALPAIFLGIVSAILPMDLLYRRLLGPRYAEYQVYSRGRVGFDAQRVVKWLVGLVVLLAVGFFLGGINYATAFDDRGITTRRLWGGGAPGGFHSYEEITAIEARKDFVAPNGNRIYRPHYVIVFSDGTTWSTRGLFRSPEPARDDSIMTFVSERSWIPITAAREGP